MRDDCVKAKKHHEGWSKLVKNEFWVPVNEQAKVVSEKTLFSPIAQVPSAGYVQKDNFSKASIQWLEYLMELAKRQGKRLYIEHAVNSHEQAIQGTSYKVDGKAGTTVYEYHGKRLLVNVKCINFVIRFEI